MSSKHIQDELMKHVNQLLSEPFARQNHLAESPMEGIERTFEEMDELVGSGNPPEGWETLMDSYERCRALFCQILLEMEMLGWTNPAQETLQGLLHREHEAAPASSSADQTRQDFEDLLNQDPLGEKTWSWEPEDPSNPPEEFLKQNAAPGPDDPTLIREMPFPAESDGNLWSAEEPETKTDIGAAISWETPADTGTFAAPPETPEAEAAPETPAAGMDFAPVDFDPADLAPQGFGEEEELIPPPPEQLAPVGATPPFEPPVSSEKLQPPAPPAPPAAPAVPTPPPAPATAANAIPVPPPAAVRAPGEASAPAAPPAPRAPAPLPPMMDIAELSVPEAVPGDPENADPLFVEADPDTSLQVAPEEILADLPEVPEASDTSLPEQGPDRGEEDHRGIADFIHHLGLQGTAPFSPRAAERYQCVARVFALEKALLNFLAAPLARLHASLENAIAPYVQNPDLPEHLRKALSPLAGDHPQWIPEGGIPVHAVANCLHFLKTVQAHPFQPAVLEAGVLVFFFGQQARYGVWETQNLLGLSGWDAGETAEFFLRCLRVQGFRNRVFRQGDEALPTAELTADHERLMELLSKAGALAKVA